MYTVACRGYWSSLCWLMHIESWCHLLAVTLDVDWTLYHNQMVEPPQFTGTVGLSAVIDHANGSKWQFELPTDSLFLHQELLEIVTIDLKTCSHWINLLKLEGFFGGETMTCAFLDFHFRFESSLRSEVAQARLIFCTSTIPMALFFFTACLFRITLKRTFFFFFFFFLVLREGSSRCASINDCLEVTSQTIKTQG